MKSVFTIVAAFIAVGAAATTAEAEHVQRALVIGGGEVPVNTKLYTAGLRETVDGISYCGGTLIAPKYVLTSTGCSWNASYVAVGTHYISGTTDGEVIPVESVLLHPLALNKTNTHDFALLKLKNSSKFTSVKLPAANFTVEPGTWMRGMGWGNMSLENGPASHELLSVDVEVWLDGYCRNIHTFVGNADFCARGYPGYDMCFGDQGGPLIMEGEEGDDDDLLVGVTSGAYCSENGVPSVFARVAAAVDWIHNVTTDSESVAKSTQVM